MMGEKRGGQARLFYEFNLELWLRRVTCFERSMRCSIFPGFALSWPRIYSHTGRPSIDAELMIRMLLVGYCYG